MKAAPRRAGDWGWLFAGSINIVLVSAILIYAATVLPGGIALANGSVSQQIGDVLAFSLLCGLASFATVEVLKRLVGLRGLYQSRQTRLWLGERARGMGAAAMDQLLDAMGLRGPDRRGDRQASLRVFNLPTEQLAGQVSTAADVALATAASEGDRYRWLLSALANQPALLSGKPPSHDPEHDPDEARRKEDFQISQRIQAGVDQLQISLGERWRRYVQGAALWISGAYGIALVHTSSVAQGAASRYVIAALLIGGTFAWVARDLAAAVERWRR